MVKATTNRHTLAIKIRILKCNAWPSNHAWSRFFVVLRRVLSELLNWKNNPLYSAFLILYFRVCFLYPVPVPDERYVLNDERRKHEMLRLLGILSLSRMIFGGHHCHCRHWHYHRHHGSFLGRSILLGTLLGLFASRANRDRYEEV